MRNILVVVALLSLACAGRNAEKFSKEGFRAYTAKDYPAAVKAYAAAVELQPNDVRYRKSLALSYANMKHYDMAEVQLREALRLQPGDMEASRNLTIVRSRIEYRAQP